ncbi:ABC transporter permease [Jiangella muralis]|uniref:ABC transporter permease n=1 Tax=Jiangella muralis TaxID=702383 RepID=UPI0009FB4D82|nr:ABC transporter permease [Jiangella muralis]
MSGRAQLALRRLAQVLPVLLLLLLTVFALRAILPGDPARSIAGPRATEAQVEEVRDRLGFDEPLPVAFASFLEDVTQGQLGVSNRTHQPVAELIVQRAPVTLSIAIGAVATTFLIGIPLGWYLALRRGRADADAASAVLIAVVNVPAFWLGLMLSILVGLRWGVLPVGGLEPGVTGWIRSMILPCLTVGLVAAPWVARSVATSIGGILASDFVTTARSLRFSGWSLFLHHLLRNALPPTVTLLALQAGSLLFGAVVVEQVFALPGLGSALLEAAASRDFAVVQGLTLVLGAAIILVNAAGDVAVAVLDPRTRWD